MWFMYCRWCLVKTVRLLPEDQNLHGSASYNKRTISLPHNQFICHPAMIAHPHIVLLSVKFTL